MLKPALVLAGIQAILLTSTLRDLTNSWERVLLHIEVIPFYIAPEELSFERIPIHESQLQVSESGLDLQYHLVQPSSLPQSEYLEAQRRLRTERTETVLSWLVGSLLWRQSVLFAFLIYEPERQPKDIGGLFVRGNTSYNIQTLETNNTGEYLVLHLAYSQQLSLSNLHQLLRPV